MELLLVLPLLLSTQGNARPNSFPGENRRRRDSVVNLHFVKRSLLPFNMTFLQKRDYYDINVDDVIEESVESFLHMELEESYRFFYGLELETMPSSTALEWPNVRINVSFAGSFVFVLSGVIPEDSELHCLQQELLLDSYVSEYEDLVEFNETGVVELDYIDFGDEVVSCSQMDDDDAIRDGTGDQETDDGKMDKNTQSTAQSSSRQPEEKSINLKDFLLSREFLFGALGTLLLAMLVCFGCVCRQTRKVRRRQKPKADKNKRRRSSTRKTSVMTPLQFLGPSPDNSIESL